MIAEVLSIGDELTSGQRLDTNSQWISQQLGDLGIRVVYHTTVADVLEANVSVFQTALQRADVVICTGGLGPTADDLTRVAIAKALGVDLYRDEPSLVHIKSLFARRNRPMPTQNEVQADFPIGTTPIFNANGSAPGICLNRLDQMPKRLLLAFPGVPAELKEMFAQSAIPLLEEFLGNQRRLIRHRPIRCFGLGESDLESRLPDLIRRGRDPQVGITASAATITLRISAEGITEEECAEKIAQTESLIRTTLGDIVFGVDDQELQNVLVEQLSKQGQTLSLAEVGTGGYLSHLFSQADPQGLTFQGGWVARNTSVMERMAGMEIAIDQSASQLASQVRDSMNTDYAIAIDNFPDNDSDLLRIAVATKSKVIAEEKPFGGHPSILLPRAAKQAMNMLRLWMLNGR